MMKLDKNDLNTSFSFSDEASCLKFKNDFKIFLGSKPEKFKSIGATQKVLVFL